MAFTDHCDVFGAVHEDGINLVAWHVRRQRPSLFNYGTALFANNPQLLCKGIDAHPEVLRRHNPLITVEDPIPIPGTDGLIGLDFCFQLTEAKIDFHKGDIINLPPELNPPLQPQRVAIYVQVCGGIVCPEREVAEKFGEVIASRSPPIRLPGSDRKDNERPPNNPDGPRPPIRPIPGRKALCFCLDVYAVAHVEIIGPSGAEVLATKLDGLEIVDIKPDGLESNIECLLATTLRVGILPKVRIALDTLTFELGKFAKLKVKPTPTSAAIPNNPAIEDNQLKVFVNVEVLP